MADWSPRFAHQFSGPAKSPEQAAADYGAANCASPSRGEALVQLLTVPDSDKTHSVMVKTLNHRLEGANQCLLLALRP